MKRMVRRLAPPPTIVSALLGMMAWVPILLAASAAGAEDKAVVAVDPEVCRALLSEARDVPSADYTPGVDVRGKPVVPAEGPNGAPDHGLPETIVIDLDVNVAQRLGLALGAGVAPDAKLGSLTVAQGQVLLNGQPLHRRNRADLVRACRQAAEEAE